MKQIPEMVVRRLPLYLRKLDALAEQGVTKVSSGELCRSLHLPPSLFRQDLDSFGGKFRKTALSYEVAELQEGIRGILGLHEELSAILIGAGKIGSALIEHFDFIMDGYTFLGAFDVRDEMIGTDIAGIRVYDVKELGEFIRQNKVDIAILTVPYNAAQQITDTLVDSGIRAIWNFTNEELDVGESGVLVENVHFSDSLMTLNYYLTHDRKPCERDA